MLKMRRRQTRAGHLYIQPADLCECAGVGRGYCTDKVIDSLRAVEPIDDAILRFASAIVAAFGEILFSQRCRAINQMR